MPDTGPRQMPTFGDGPCAHQERTVASEAGRFVYGSHFLSGTFPGVEQAFW
jgi:hypothetical protein